MGQMIWQSVWEKYDVCDRLETLETGRENRSRVASVLLALVGCVD